MSVTGGKDSAAASEVVMQDRGARTWIWASLILQFLGYVLDVIWHGLLNPGVEPQTASEMARHLSTVHLPLYVGAASVLVSTSRALLHVRHRIPRGRDRDIAVQLVPSAWR